MHDSLWSRNNRHVLGCRKDVQYERNCMVGTVISGYGYIPTDGTEVQILSGSASMTALPDHGRSVVAHLGEVSIAPQAASARSSHQTLV